MYVFIAIIVGLILGSFLSVLIARWPQWRGVATGRSRCPACHHMLAWYDLVPLVSWLTLRGKCRYCGAHISVRYPMLEIALASSLGLVALIHPHAPLEYVVVALLVSLFFFDLWHMVLPDILVFLLVGISIVRLLAAGPVSLANGIFSAIALASFFGIGYIVSRGRWLGFGDVKLAAVIGLLFGTPLAIGVTILAIWAGGLVGIALIALRRATRKTSLPFGSFWTAVAVLTLVWPGPALWVGRLFTFSMQ